MYGLKWWLYQLPNSTEYVWMCRGFGGQNLQVFPKEGPNRHLHGLGHSPELDHFKSRPRPTFCLP